MPTLILSPRYSEDSRALRGAALRAGWEVERCQRWRLPPESPALSLPLGELTRELAFYGEPLFCAATALQLGGALLEPNFDWLACLPGELVRREVGFCALSEARGLPGPRFFKPADDKAFKAAVYPSGAELPAGLAGELLCLHAEPVRFELEVRCFVLGGEVVALSPYLREGELAGTGERWPFEPGEEAAARAAAAAAIAAAPLPPAVVLDVGRIAGRGWAPVELNPAFASGLYGAERGPVLEVLRRVFVASPHPGSPDARWIQERPPLE